MQNQSFQNSLKCLQHPATWVSIFMLLINDHLLKTTYPSWISGKLSDFAGIFFFPFLIAVVFSIFFDKFNLSIRATGQIVFGFVVVWFILLKTSPFANQLTAELTSLVVGFPTKFSLDVTDLISLIVLIPAWKIWSQPSLRKNNQMAYLGLALATLATIADSPAAPPSISKITSLDYYKDGIVYAADREATDSENYYPVAKSLDGGITWEEAPEISNIEERGLPIKHCSHLYPEICYKLTKSGKLQELSSNGAWIDVKGLEIKINPYETKKIKVYDLILFEWEEKEYAIIAIGEYGIWRQELPNGDWSEISVLYADE
jgi:hypothetical protein